MTNQSNDMPEGCMMTELGLLPDDWRVVSLGSIFSEVDRTVANYPDADAAAFPVLSLTKNYGLMLQSERFGKRIALEDVSSYRVVKRGEIVYNPYVIWEGAIHILDHFDRGLVSPVYPVLSTNVELADPYYLDPLLRTHLAISAYNRFASGAVNRRRSIRKTDFMAVRIPLPPLSEQKAIARVLSTIQKAIEAQDKVIAAARETKRSLMRHLFAYGPVPVADAERVLLKETEIGPLPEHWQVKRIEEVASFTSKPRGLDIADFEDVPFIPMEAISNDGSGRMRYNTRPGKGITSGVYCEPGNLLIAKITPCLENEKQCLVSHDLPTPFAYATTEAYPISTNQSATDIRFLFYYLLYPPVRRDLASKMEGSTGRQRLPKHVVQNRLLPLPPLHEQERIAQALSSLSLKVESEQKRKASLQSLFKTMLHHLMTGKLRVKDLGVTSE